MRSAGARLRALQVCVAVALCAIGFSVPANADDVPTPTPVPRAVPAARSYPRTFASYEALIDYADGVAATLATVFDPRVRGGLLRSRTDLMDDATFGALRKEVTNDVTSVGQLVADG